MKIVKLKAGLGNQMFQYAFYKLLIHVFGFENVLMDTSYYNHRNYKKYLNNGINLLSVSYDVATKNDLHKLRVVYNCFEPHHFLHRMIAGAQAVFNRNYFFEKNRDFVNPDTIINYSYFDGYWQSWRYLEPIRHILVNDFKPKNALSELTTHYIQTISLKNAVFIGIRKGDYAQSLKSRGHYGLPDKEYYKKAIQTILSRTVNPFFIVFSDDINWVKDTFDFDEIGISSNDIDYREKHQIYNDFEELFVMASCKHAIISNSTFNFWGAWLIGNENKIVVAPKKWFKDGKPIDIVPPSWVQL